MKKKEKAYERSTAIMNKAVGIANSGDSNKALGLFIQAYELCNENTKAIISIVQCYIYLERYSEAIPYIEKAEYNINFADKIGIHSAGRKRLEEFKSSVYTFKGICLFYQKQFKAALDLFNSALAIDPYKRDALQMKDACEKIFNLHRH